MKERGFTVIELLIAITFLVVAGSIFLVQKRDIETANRDSQRKTAINAMYYALEEVYYKQHQGYPRTVTSAVLSGVDPVHFKDPSGKAINTNGADYRYEPTGCDQSTCRGYTLRARLEKELDFVRQSRND